jgi:hypothetical protein
LQTASRRAAVTQRAAGAMKAPTKTWARKCWPTGFAITAADTMADAATKIVGSRVLCRSPCKRLNPSCRSTSTKNTSHHGITATGQFITRMCRDYANGREAFVAGVEPCW